MLLTNPCLPNSQSNFHTHYQKCVLKGDANYMIFPNTSNNCWRWSYIHYCIQRKQTLWNKRLVLLLENRSYFFFQLMTRLIECSSRITCKTKSLVPCCSVNESVLWTSWDLHYFQIVQAREQKLLCPYYQYPHLIPT